MIPAHWLSIQNTHRARAETPFLIQPLRTLASVHPANPADPAHPIYSLVWGDCAMGANTLHEIVVLTPTRNGSETVYSIMSESYEFLFLYIYHICMLFIWHVYHMYVYIYICICIPIIHIYVYVYVTQICCIYHIHTIYIYIYTSSFRFATPKKNLYICLLGTYQNI